MKQILMFLLFAALLAWLMFAPVYKHILIVRQALIQKEVDYLLEIGANGSYGYINQTMIDESKARLAEHGFHRNELQYTITTTNGTDGTNPSIPVHRGVGIKLVVTYPYGNLFGIDRLIGISGPDGAERMGASGMKMSEYVP